jgi:hypothetical protein
MLRNTHHRRLLATAATTAVALASTAPAASAIPVDNGRSTSSVPVKVVRVQVDDGLDWGDAGIGAAGMLALVLVGFGGAHALTSTSERRRNGRVPA